MDTLGELLAPVVMALLTAAAGWLVTKLPGPLRDWLASGTHQRDIELLLGAMMRRAQASMASSAGPAVPADLIAYVAESLPDTLAKLRPNDQALLTMAIAVLRQANQPVSSQIVPPPHVVVGK